MRRQKSLSSKELFELARKREQEAEEGERRAEELEREIHLSLSCKRLASEAAVVGEVGGWSGAGTVEGGAGHVRLTSLDPISPSNEVQVQVLSPRPSGGHPLYLAGHPPMFTMPKSEKYQKMMLKKQKRAIKKEKNVLTTCITEERNGQDLNSVLKSLGEISVVNKGPDPAGKQKSKKKKVNATAMSEDVQDVISEEKTDDKENESTSNVGVGDEFKQLEHSTKTFPKTSNASAVEGIGVEIEIEKVAGSVENWSTESAVTSVSDIKQVPDSTGKNKSSRKMANATFVKEDSHDFVSEAMTDDREKETLSKVKELEDEIRLLNEKHNIFIEEKGKEMTKLLNIVDEKEDLIHKNGKKISSLKEEIRNLQKDSEEQGKAVLKADGKKKRLEEYMTKTTDEFKVNRDALNRKLWKFKDQVRNIQENNRTIQKESKKENSTEIPENPLLEVLNEHIASKTRDLECPVCMEVAKPPAPLFMCQDSHLICSECKPRLDKCPTCRLTYNDPVLKNRLAENSRDELTKLRKQRDKFLATL